MRALIIADYNGDPANVNSVFLFGHVPVLQSGFIDYDTHGARPMPADPYYGDGGLRWRHRHWHRGYGYRDYGYGYRGHRYGYRGYGYGARFGYRTGWRARHMVGPGGIWRGSRFAHVPRARFDMPHRMRMMNMPMRHMGPGVVHPPRHMGPMGGPKRMMP